ncbi:MAG: hypothetical protein BWY87_00124 [Deltaproteobacteria bacterium ADurb.Bin510]|nr:MAG: hypothetical protein BWY87_00124 [Deltaproteobacteria bacterium ADurb.Bin510]
MEHPEIQAGMPGGTEQPRSRRDTLLLGLAVLLIALGTASWVYSLTLAPYTGEGEFHQSIASMQDGDEQQYYALRQRMLTHKYRLEDYGLTLLLLGLGVLIVNRARPVRSPRNLIGFGVVAVAAPSFQAATFAVSLIQSLQRLENPWWIDAIGQPLTGLPIAFGLCLALALGHLLLLKNVRCESVPLRLALSRRANCWLRLEAGAVTALMIVFSLKGAYLHALPLTTWLYYFLSLAAVRRNGLTLSTPA